MKHGFYSIYIHRQTNFSEKLSIHIVEKKLLVNYPILLGNLEK